MECLNREFPRGQWTDEHWTLEIGVLLWQGEIRGAHWSALVAIVSLDVTLNQWEFKPHAEQRRTCLISCRSATVVPIAFGQSVIHSIIKCNILLFRFLHNRPASWPHNYRGDEHLTSKWPASDQQEWKQSSDLALFIKLSNNNFPLLPLSSLAYLLLYYQSAAIPITLHWTSYITNTDGSNNMSAAQAQQLPACVSGHHTHILAQIYSASWVLVVVQAAKQLRVGWIQ